MACALRAQTHARLRSQFRRDFFCISATRELLRVIARAIEQGLRRWYPELLPTFRLFYARTGRLFTISKEGRLLAVDSSGALYGSTEGCSQGDPLGPFYWAVGYHETLLETQARHPDTCVWAYLDDTYYGNEPAKGLAAMRTGGSICPQLCGVQSNLKKQEVYGKAEADLSMLPPTLKGAPSAPPSTDYDAASGVGYAGGRLRSIKVLGAFLGQASECSARLLARVETHLGNLVKVSRLRDTRRDKVALQVQLEINRFCGNTSLVYFLRTMGVEVTRDAAARHDALIEAAFHRIVGTGLATPGQSSRAVMQARLPVNMGGMGLTSQSLIADAATIGSWALCWRPMCRLCPQLFGDVDISTSSLRPLRELRQAHQRTLEVHRRVELTYAEWDAAYYDYNKDGEGCARFHPANLPPRHTMVPISEFSAATQFLQHAKISCLQYSTVRVCLPGGLLCPVLRRLGRSV